MAASLSSQAATTFDISFSMASLLASFCSRSIWKKNSDSQFRENAADGIRKISKKKSYNNFSHF
jgi:hypothetical protein